MYLWEIFRGFEENLANRTNWIIIREFRINMRKNCHFQSLLASQLPHWPSAPPWCSCCFHESQMQSEQETVDVWYRFNESLFKTQVHDYDVNLTSFFSAQFCSRSGAEKQFADKNQLYLQETVLLFHCPLELYPNHPLSWHGSLESSVFLQERLQCRPRPCLQPLQPCLVSAHHGTSRPAFQPALPSVLCRSEPSPHSELTPELPVTLAWRLSSTSQNFNHGEYNSDRIK